MASFGRRPAKTGSTRAGNSASSRPAEPTRSKLEQLKEEEEERKRFAEEFQERSRRDSKDYAQQRKTEEYEKQEHKRLLSERKGKPNPVVFLEIEVRDRSGRCQASGRLEIELFADQVPRTAENFRCLCTGEKGKTLHYKGSTFHRIIPGFMAQGGDITNGDGTGGVSIYGARFADESFVRLHARCNLLSMANSGPNSNNSQFFVLFKQCKHLDRKHVVFGEIIREDGTIMKRIEAQGSEDGDVAGSVVIVRCGELTAKDEQSSRERFRNRSLTRSASRRKKQRKCYI